MKKYHNLFVSIRIKVKLYYKEKNVYFICKYFKLKTVNNHFVYEKQMLV